MTSEVNRLAKDNESLNPDLNTVDFRIWGGKFSKMYTKVEIYLIWTPL